MIFFASYITFLLMAFTVDRTDGHKKNMEGVLIMGGINLTGVPPQPMLQIVNTIFNESTVRNPYFPKPPVYDMACAPYFDGVNHVVMVCGGHTLDAGATWRDDCITYRINSNSVQRVATLKQGRAHHNLISNENNKFYAIGGLTTPETEDGEPKELDSCEKLVCTTKVMSYCFRYASTPCASLPAPRWSFSCVYYRSKIYCFGGSSGFESNIVTYDDTFIYDEKTDKWASGARMPVKRGSFACALLRNQGLIMCCGGSSDGITALNTCDIYDVDKNTWSTGPTMLENRFEPRMSVYNQRVHVIGGSADRNTLSSTIEIYDESKKKFVYAQQTVAGAKFLFCAVPIEFHSKRR